MVGPEGLIAGAGQAPMMRLGAEAPRQDPIFRRDAPGAGPRPVRRGQGPGPACRLRPGCPAFSLNLLGLGCFPNTRRPRIVWVGISEETDTLTKLHQTLGEQLHQRIGFQPGSRPYSPHLTIGRVKKETLKSKLQKRQDEWDKILKHSGSGQNRLVLMEMILWDAVHSEWLPAIQKA